MKQTKTKSEWLAQLYCGTSDFGTFMAKTCCTSLFAARASLKGSIMETAKRWLTLQQQISKQPTKQLASQPANQLSTNQPTNQAKPTKQPTNHILNPPKLSVACTCRFQQTKHESQTTTTGGNPNIWQTAIHCQGSNNLPKPRNP